MIQHPQIACEHARDRIDRYRHEAAIQRAIRAAPRAQRGANARQRIAASIHRFAAWIDVDAPHPVSREPELRSAR